MLRIRSVIKADLGQHSFGHALGTIYLIYMYVHIYTHFILYILSIYLTMSYSFRQFFYAPISLGRKFYFNASESQITHNVGASPTKRTATHLLANTHIHTHPFLHLLTLTYTFNSWSRASAQWTRPACTLPAPAPSPFPLPLLGNYPHIFWPQVEPFPISFDFKSNFWARSAKNNWMRLSR